MDPAVRTGARSSTSRPGDGGPMLARKEVTRVSLRSTVDMPRGSGLPGDRLFSVKFSPGEHCEAELLLPLLNGGCEPLARPLVVGG